MCECECLVYDHLPCQLNATVSVSQAFPYLTQEIAQTQVCLLICILHSKFALASFCPGLSPIS